MTRFGPISIHRLTPVRARATQDTPTPGMMGDISSEGKQHCYVLGVPVGSATYVQAWLQEKARKMCSDMNGVAQHCSEQTAYYMSTCSGALYRRTSIY